jgi:hypothetical protein
MSEHVKLTSGKGTMAQRIADRLKNSGAGSGAEQTIQTGNSPQRVYHNLHCSGQRGPMSNEGGAQGGPLGNPRSGR